MRSSSTCLVVKTSILTRIRVDPLDNTSLTPSKSKERAARELFVVAVGLKHGDLSGNTLRVKWPEVADCREEHVVPPSSPLKKSYPVAIFL